MKKRTLLLLIAGSFLIGIGRLGNVIWSGQYEDGFNFLSGAGAGAVFGAAIWYLLERRGLIRSDGAREWPPGSKRIMLLVFGGLALVFLVFWLIFGPQQ